MRHGCRLPTSGPAHSCSPAHSLLARHPRGRDRACLCTAVFLAWTHVCSHATHADSGRVEMGARLAPSWETHNGDRPTLENTYKRGVSAGAGVRYGVLDALAVELELLYASRGTGLSYGGMARGGLHFTYVQMPLLARLGWTVPGLRDARGGRPLAVYLVGGPTVSYLLDAQDVLTDGTTRPFERTSRLDAGVIGGLGVAWDITPRWAASLELRYEAGLIDTLPEASHGLETKNRAVLLALGLDYTINDRDRDRDRVPDARDRCLTRAEDHNGYQDSDGCPDDDRDRDGLAAGVDVCPEQAEDRDGFEDHDGCPEADNDQDGFADQVDDCPGEAFPRMRGCPPRFERVRVEPDRLVLDPPLVFASKSAALDDQARETLDQVAALLTHHHPHMRLRLEGHADGRGKDRFNLPLTRSRAEAVRRYLIERGIAPERLSVKGFGQDRPAYFERDPTGMQRNRRVELVILDD